MLAVLPKRVASAALPTPAARGLATSSSSATAQSRDEQVLRSVKSIIARVHPDRFVHDETMRRVNEASLQALNGVIDEVRGVTSGVSSRPVQLVFFHRRRDGSGAYQDLRVVLRPGPGASLVGVLRPLLKAFGFPVPAGGHGGDARGARVRGFDPTQRPTVRYNLQDSERFARTVARGVHSAWRKQEELDEADRQVDALLSQLRLDTCSPVLSFSLSVLLTERLPALQRLEHAVASCTTLPFAPCLVLRIADSTSASSSFVDPSAGVLMLSGPLNHLAVSLCDHALLRRAALAHIAWLDFLESTRMEQLYPQTGWESVFGATSDASDTAAGASRLDAVPMHLAQQLPLLSLSPLLSDRDQHSAVAAVSAALETLPPTEQADLRCVVIRLVPSVLRGVYDVRSYQDVAGVVFLAVDAPSVMAEFLAAVDPSRCMQRFLGTLDEWELQQLGRS